VTALVDQFYAEVQAMGGQALGHVQPDPPPAQVGAEAPGASPGAPAAARRLQARAGCRLGPVGQFGLGEDLEHPHHLLHAGHERPVGATRWLALGDAAHQVDDAALGHHLEGVGLHVLGVDEAWP
jgi:hypothetical protein